MVALGCSKGNFGPGGALDLEGGGPTDTSFLKGEKVPWW